MGINYIELCDKKSHTNHVLHILKTILIKKINIYYLFIIIIIIIIIIGQGHTCEVTVTLLCDYTLRFL